MERDKQIEERSDLALIVDYAVRDWQDYRDACHEDGLDVAESMEESIAAAVLANGYRKQSEGEWIMHIYNDHCSCGKSRKVARYECSACKRIADMQPYGLSFCPNCGAKMKGE